VVGSKFDGSQLLFSPKTYGFLYANFLKWWGHKQLLAQNAEMRRDELEIRRDELEMSWDELAMRRDSGIIERGFPMQGMKVIEGVKTEEMEKQALREDFRFISEWKVDPDLQKDMYVV
jgi:hypothetical protein